MRAVPSSTFSFRLATFVGTLILTACLTEVYARSSSRFEGYRYEYLRAVHSADPSKYADLGDSHVGLTSRIAGYAFLGQNGQQPEELLALVKHLYKKTAPARVILEASPQWFGEYHLGQEPLISSAILAPPIEVLGFRIRALSQPYSGAIFGNLLSDFNAILVLPFSVARAAAVKPPRDEFLRSAKEWEAIESDVTFDWSKLSERSRKILIIPPF